MITKRPFWVRIILFSLRTRSSAVRWVALSLVGALGGLVGAFWDPRTLYAGFGFLIAAALYWGAVRWVDLNDSWAE